MTKTVMTKAVMTKAVLWLLLVFWGSCNTVDPAGRQQRAATVNLADYKNGKAIFITAPQLKARLGEKKLVLLDASSPHTYGKGHIEGALHIGFHGLSDISGKKGDLGWGTILKPEAMAKKLASLGIDNETFVVVYADTLKGPGSGGRILWQLHMAGFKSARMLFGGLSAWRKQRYALSTVAGVPVPVPVEKVVVKDYDRSQAVSKEEILASLKPDGKTNPPLIDVRSKGEFTGEDHSRGEARAGHITGAKWISWKTFLNADGSPKSSQAIVDLMKKLGVGLNDDFSLY